MKKILLAVLLFATATACNNNSNETAVEGDSTVKTAPAVDNVNGNIPDSTNTIDVGTNDGSVNQ
jgi:hypothetical protein